MPAAQGCNRPLSALSTLLSNWRSVVEEGAFLPDERKDKKSGQQRFKLGE